MGFILGRTPTRALGTRPTDVPSPASTDTSAAVSPLALEALNTSLSALPCCTATDIFFCVAERAFRATGGAGGPISVAVVDPGSGADARTRVRFASSEALRRLASEGQNAAMVLMARGQMSVAGELEAVQRLGEELAPHAAALHPLLADVAFGAGAPPVVRWVADAEAAACMCCARRFKLSRRRHHCRVCGEVCCARCAPKRLDASTGRSQRTCERCVARGPPRVNLSLARQQPPPSAHSSPLSASASGPSTPSTSPSPFAGGGGGLTPPVADSHGPGGGGGGGGMSHAALLEVYIEDALHRLALCWYGLRAASIGLTLLLLATAFVHAAGWRGRAAVAATAAGLVPLRPFVLRYYRIVWLCAVVSWRVGCASLAVRGRSAAAADALWEMTHRVNARFVYDTVASLGGFWVKLAQATSVSSALPEVYKLELAQLQDAMPADDLPSVHRLLEAEQRRRPATAEWDHPWEVRDARRRSLGRSGARRSSCTTARRSALPPSRRCTARGCAWCARAGGWRRLREWSRCSTGTGMWSAQ